MIKFYDFTAGQRGGGVIHIKNYIVGRSAWCDAIRFMFCFYDITGPQQLLNTISQLTSRRVKNNPKQEFDAISSGCMHFFVSNIYISLSGLYSTYPENLKEIHHDMGSLETCWGGLGATYLWRSGDRLEPLKLHFLSFKYQGVSERLWGCMRVL